MKPVRVSDRRSPLSPIKKGINTNLKRIGVIFGVALLFLGVALVSPGRALSGLRGFYLAESSDSIESLQQQQQQIDQQQSQTQQQRQQVQQQEKSAQEQLGGLQSSIRVTSGQIAENEKKLKNANEHLKQLQQELARAAAKHQDKQLAMVARLRYLQRQQSSSGWALLLQSENLNEFLDRRFQLRLIYQSDRQVLAELRQAANQLEQRQRGVASQKNQIALITQELQAQKTEYQAQAQTQQELIKRLQHDRRALEAAEEQLAKDSENIAALIRQRQAEKTGGTGIMGYPSDGVITSGFGYRTHPILGYSRFHSGLDFGADYGSPIKAADSGVVIFAGWYGGYGQAVILDHGSGITTLYGHTSEIYVSEGQAVQRGQVIAAIGSTGLSTGPHLHFEVRVSGEPADPASYL